MWMFTIVNIQDTLSSTENTGFSYFNQFWHLMKIRIRKESMYVTNIE